MNPRTIVAIIYGTGVFQVNVEHPFVLVSKKISPIYLDNRRLISFPHEREIIVSALVEETKKIGLRKFKIISGGETADIPFASWVAQRIKLPLVYVRKEAKGYGAGKRVEGAIELIQGSSVLHVSDLITTGGSALSWVAAIREAGGTIADYLTIFDRRQGAAEALLREGVTLHSLVSLNDEFLQLGGNLGVVSAQGLEEIKRYLSDSDGWGTEYILAHPEFIRSKGSEGRLILQTAYPHLMKRLGE